MSSIRLLFVLFLCVFYLPATASGSEVNYPEMMIVLDGSGSMWAKLEDETKIESARSVLSKIVPEFPAEVKLGLAAYGHNRKGDCDDIEILASPGATDRDQLLGQALAINPKGKTPIAATLKLVTDQLKGNENETSIVLVSDGEETCHDDPCGAVKAMHDSGIKFTLHVVGFGVNDMQQEQLSCLAEAGGGNYYAAKDAEALAASFEQVQERMVEKVEQAKTSTRKVTSGLGKLQITIPEAGLISLNQFRIVRSSDGKTVKTIENPRADSTHPLLAGEYELIAGFANANYKPDSEVSFGTWTVSGGETQLVELGLLQVNISEELKPMAAGAVIITKPDSSDFELVIPNPGNDYYLYKPKPLPAGDYRFGVHYKRSYLYRTPETPVTLVDELSVPAAGEGYATIDSGIQLIKPQAEGVIGFELASSDGDWGTMKIAAASNGDYPLWQVYGVPPGSYQLNVFLEGMDEALPVASDLKVEAGVLLEIDTGL